MFFLAYISSATPKLNEDNIIDILIDSRRRNAEKSITGLLLYIDGTIVQVIEGDEHDVIQLFSKIEQDRRHYSITKITEGVTEERIFKDWSMGFKLTSYDELEKFTGYPNISKNSFLPSDSESIEHESIRILKAFYENYQKTNK